VVAGATLLYFYLFMFFPKPVLTSLLALPLLVGALFLCSNPRSWVLVLLPVAVTFGNRVFDYGPLYVSVATLAVLSTAMFYLVYKIAGFRSFPRLPVPVYLLLAAYLAQLASLFVSLHFSGNLFGNTFREAHKVFIAAVLVPVIYDWYGRGDWFARMLKMLAIMLLCMSVYGIYQYNAGNLDTFGEKASGYDLAGRVYSTISGGPNSYSGVLELLVPTVLASMFFFKEKKWKVIALAAALLGIQNVMYTFSRGGFVTVTLSCFVYLIFRYRKKMWVPVLALTLFAGALFANADEFKRQLTLFGDTRSLMMDTSLLHRYTSYMGFWNTIQRDPINGIGWGSSEFYHGRTSLYSFWEVRHEDSIAKITRFGGLNSLVLEMPLKGGVFSLLSLLLLGGACVVASVKFIRTGNDTSPGMGMICGLAAFGIHQAVDNLLPWPQTGAFFWMVLALLISSAYPCCGKETDSL